MAPAEQDLRPALGVGPWSLSAAIPRELRLSAGLMVAVFVIFLDLVGRGWLLQLDRTVSEIWLYVGPHEMPIADFFDRIGQRTICLPLLFGVAYLLSRRLGSIRPLVIAVAGTIGLNFIVGVVKILTLRESPRTGGPELFVGNNLFPSGHTANVVFVYGLAAALIVRYGKVSDRLQALLAMTVIALFFFMMVIATYRHTHWFTDLVAGGLVGAVTLDLCMRADAAWPECRRWLRQRAGDSWYWVEWLVQRVRPVIGQPMGEPTYPRYGRPVRRSTPLRRSRPPLRQARRVTARARSSAAVRSPAPIRSVEQSGNGDERGNGKGGGKPPLRGRVG